MAKQQQSRGEASNRRFKFSTQRTVQATEANLFIHGYSAGHDLDDRQALSCSIPHELHAQLNIFAFWESSHFTRINPTTKKLILAATRVHVAASLVALAADRVVHFAAIRNRAEEMGGVLFAQLREYLKQHHPEVTRVNLIGHSLGGRVVVTALRNQPLMQSGLSPQIDNVLLMAAAVEVSSTDAAAMVQRIDGRLINAYSRADGVLLLNADETCLGRNEVKFFDNVHMEKFDHSDYWPKLRDVMKKAAFSVLADPDTSLALRPENDFAKKDIHLYQVLACSDAGLLEAAITHLKSSSWTSISDGESDRALAFTRELQAVAGHCLVNFARGNGLRYSKVLMMLAEHYGLGAQLHHCAKVYEYEGVLLNHVFQHAFPEGHPLANASIEAVKALPQSDYLAAVDALAKRLTLASCFQLSGEADTPLVSLPAEQGAMASDIAFADTVQTYWQGAVERLRSLEKQATRVLTNLSTAIKPGYSALIPAIAVVHYARLQLGDEYLI